MIQIFRRFFNFCGEINKRKFTKSIFLGVLKALFEALKIPAIAVTLQGVLSGNLTVQHILLSFGIMLLSIAGNAFANYCSTMLQCEAGYGTCADKRIEIAEHLKYLPTGYFTKQPWLYHLRRHQQHGGSGRCCHPCCHDGDPGYSDYGGGCADDFVL